MGKNFLAWALVVLAPLAIGALALLRWQAPNEPRPLDVDATLR